MALAAIAREAQRDDLRVDHVPARARQAVLRGVDRGGLARISIAGLSLVISDVEVGLRFAVAAHCAIARTSRRMVRQISVMGSR